MSGRVYIQTQELWLQGPGFLPYYYTASLQWHKTQLCKILNYDKIWWTQVKEDPLYLKNKLGNYTV